MNLNYYANKPYKSMSSLLLNSRLLDSALVYFYCVNVLLCLLQKFQIPTNFRRIRDIQPFFPEYFDGYLECAPP